MDIIISLLIVSVLIGIPTWLIVHTVNKADKSTIIYSPEEVTRRLRKGFYLSFWGWICYLERFLRLFLYFATSLRFFNLLFRL